MADKVKDEDIEVIRKAALTDLGFLCREMLSMRDWGKIHDELALFLHTSGRRKHIELARGHLKSSIVTKGWTIQQVLRNPNVRILLANAVWDNSRKFLRSIQKYVGSGSLIEMYFGRFVSDHWNQDECTVTQRGVILDAPTWATTGIEKEQTSQHYDIIIADDLVARENCMTPEQRERVHIYYKDLMDLLEPDGTLIVIGTRWHQDDLYAQIIEENEEAEKTQKKKPWDLFIRTAYNPDGSVTFPEKFSLDYLDQLRASKGPYEFSAQYLNNPIDESAADFKKAWIRKYEPGTPHPHSLYLTVDPAIALSADADPSAGIVAGQFGDRRIRVVDYFHKRLNPSGLVDAIFDMVEKWKLLRIGVETFAFQKTIKYQLQEEQRRRNRFFSIDELGSRRGGKEPMLTKEARIRRLQPYFEQGLFEIRSDMKELEMELLAFPRGRYDDLIDALSYQLDYLIPSQDRVKTSQVVPGSFRDIVRKSWNAQPGSMYERFLSDLREEKPAPL